MGRVQINSKLYHLLFLAISSTAFGVVAFTTGSGLFINRVGVQFLPISYILMGLISIPIYTWLSQIVDRKSKTELSRYLLIVALILVAVFRLLIIENNPYIYYLIYISFYVQWILVTDVIFPSLVSDYFTSLDWKNYTPYLRMAVAMGGLMGGIITSLAANYFSLENILLILPFFYIIVFFQLIFLEIKETTIENSQEITINNKENLTDLIDLIKKYPIIFYLASSTFFYILLYSLSEFEYFNIYSETFKNGESLTSFLGIMRIINNIIPFFVLYFITRPLITQWGLVKMNLIYPLTLLISFSGLAINYNLPMAVFTNLNADGFEDSINQPIHNLNYNAVPYELIGKVRAISNGLFFSFGLAFAGILLLFLQTFFAPKNIIFVGIIFSILFLIIRYFMGKSYLQSLFTMLKSGSVKLTEVSEGFSHLPQEYNQQVINLLKSNDRHDQILGLELATRVCEPTIFLPQIERLLFGQDENLRSALIKFLSHVSNPTINNYLTKKLDSENYLLQIIALEALIANKYTLKSEELRHLLRQTFMRTIDKISFIRKKQDDHKQVQHILSINNHLKALICLAVIQGGKKDLELEKACDLMWQSNIDSVTKIAVIRSINRTKDRKLIPLIIELITDENISLNVKIEGLDTLANLANYQDQNLANIAVQEITNDDPLVRAAAFKLLGVICDPKLLEKVGLGLENNNLAVRLWAATALANYGEKCLKIAEKYLYSPRIEVIEAAIAVIAKINSHRSLKLLENYLKPDYQLLPEILELLTIIPAYKYPNNLIKIIFSDFQEKLVHRVLYIISRLDHKSSLPNIKHLLQTEDLRLKANAIETLSSFKYRDFIVPILPLLNNQKNPDILPSENVTGEFNKLLPKLINSPQIWLNIAAILILTQENKPIPHDLLEHSNHIVKKTALYFQKYPINLTQNFFLERIFFLKKITLFQKLFLDELLIVNDFLEEKQFYSGEIICHSNNLISELLIIYQGNVILKQENKVKEIGPYQYFGEMSLFDYTPVSVTMVAQTNCTIMTLSRDNFNHLLELCPRLLLCYSQLGYN